LDTDKFEEVHKREPWYNVYWVKVLVLRKYLPLYDWVVYMDADVVVHNYSYKSGPSPTPPHRPLSRCTWLRKELRARTSLGFQHGCNDSRLAYLITPFLQLGALPHTLLQPRGAHTLDDAPRSR
jgi:hypothetical protein